eukprot:5791067-Amphidinium_carterae.1
MKQQWNAYKSAPVPLRPRSRTRPRATPLVSEGFASSSAASREVQVQHRSKLKAAEAILQSAPDRAKALQNFNDNALAESSRR